MAAALLPVALTGFSPPAAAATFTLGTTNYVVGPAAGSGSVVLGASPATSAWTGSANAGWLHLSDAGQAGVGSTNLIFSFDANPGVTRTGTLTLAGLSLSVTQAGAPYVAAGARTPLVSSGLTRPFGVALDSAGNVYCSDLGTDALKVWGATNNTVLALPPSGHGYYPQGIAVDAAGNVYFLDTTRAALQQWSPATNQVTTLVPGGLSSGGLAVDGAGNIFIADPANNAIKVWVAAGQTLTNLGVAGLNTPNGVAVDAAGNVYVADSGNNAVKVWSPVSGTVSTLLTNLHEPYGVAVDGSGNVYVADTLSPNGAVVEWLAAGNVVVTLAAGLGVPTAVAVDATGNVYVADAGGTVQELPAAWVNPTPVVLGAAAGAAALPSVLPASQNLRGPFAPLVNQPWLGVVGITNGVVTLTNSLNSSPVPRGANLTLLGQSIALTQTGSVYNLGGTGLVVSAVAGSGNVSLMVSPPTAAWTLATDSAWLRPAVGSSNGVGSQLLGFVFDANPGPARTGMLSVGGQTFMVTQSPPVFTLAKTNFSVTAISGFVGVSLTCVPVVGQWTNFITAPWMHFFGGVTGFGGAGNTNFGIYYDDNPGGARSAVLSVAGLPVTVAQSAPVFRLSTNLFREPALGGGGSLALTVVPNVGQWTNVANNPWLHLTTGSQSGAGGANISFTCDPNPGAARSGSLTIAGQTVTVNQLAVRFAVGSTALYEGPAAGTDSVVLAGTSPNGAWTATNNVPWLHVSAANLTGAGSTNVVFSFDANTGVTRAGTLTIAGLNVSVSQAGAPYVAAGVRTPLISSGLTRPFGVALDSAGNVYCSDLGTDALKVWGATNNTVLALPPTGHGYYPQGIAVDAAGNVYFLDTAHGALQQWSPATNQVTTLVPNGLSPGGLAVDGAGNVFIADPANNAIKVWVAAGQTLTNLGLAGLNTPNGVAVDAAGNVYVADSGNNAVKVWSPVSGTVGTLLTNLHEPYGVAVDGSGNVYVADTLSPNGAVVEWLAAGNVVVTLATGVGLPTAVAVDATGNVYVADGGGTIQELPTAWVNPTPVALGAAGGAGALPAVVPSFQNLQGPFAPQSSQPWLTITGGTNGAVAYSFPLNSTPAPLQANLTVLGQVIPVTQAGAVYGLSVTNLTVAAVPGTNSLTLTVAPATAMWTATSGASWLHWLPGSQSGTGTATVKLSYDDNAGAGRTGTATIAGLTVIVTQAPPVFTLSAASVLVGAAAGSVGVGLTAVPADGLWTNTANASWLHLTGGGQTAMGSGSGTNLVYFDDNPSAARTGTVSWAGVTLTVAQKAPVFAVSTNLLPEPAVGGTATVGLTATPNVGLWTNTANAPWLHFDGANQTGVGSGPVAIRFDDNLGATRNGTVTIAGQPVTVAQAAPLFLIPTNTVYEPAVAGSFQVALTVQPNGAPWTNSSRSSWLHLGPGSQNGTGGTNLTFSFDNNTGAARTGSVVVAGQTLGVVQAAPLVNLAVPVLYEGPLAGGDGIVFGVAPARGAWNATSTVPWLHLANTNVAGTGAAYLGFTFEANPGATRTGALSLGGQLLAVTQAGATYVAAGSMTTLVGTNLMVPFGVAVDPAGNVFFSDPANDALLEWLVASNTVVKLPPSGGRYKPQGVALDGAGNVYFVDSTHGAVQMWSPATQVTTTLVTNLISATGLTVDPAGNVFVADAGTNAIKEWLAAGRTVTNLNLTGLNNPVGLATDAAGRLYIADNGNSAIKVWTGTPTLTTLLSSVPGPMGVAVDGSGNVYVAAGHGANGAILAWQAASNLVSYVVANAGINPTAVAVDGAGNVYFGDAGGTVREVPTAWVDPTLVMVSAAPGTGSLPPLLPPTANLLPPFGVVSDQSWLAAAGATNGAPGFAYTVNSGTSNRSGNLTVLGQAVPVTQTGAVFSLEVTNLAVAATAGTNLVNLSVAPAQAVWTATAGAPWLHLAAGSQSGTGPALVGIVYDDNPGATRTGMVTIAGQTVGVVQAGPVFSVATNYLSVAAVAGSVGVGLTVVPGGGLWTNTANVSWLHLAGGLATATGSGSGSIAVFFDNNSGPARTGTVSLAGQVVTVAQAAPVFSLGTNWVQESAVGGTVAVTLTALPNVGLWTNLALSSWLHFDGTNQAGAGSGPVLLRYDDNPGAARTGMVSIAGIPLTLAQSAPVFTLATNQYFEAAGAGSDQVGLVAAPQVGVWTAVANVPWLHLSVTGGAGSTNLVFSFDGNPGPGGRSGTLTVAGNVVTVNQDAPMFALGTSNLVVGASAGSHSVVLAANSPVALWSAVAVDGWLHITAGSGSGMGATNVFFTCDANPGAARTGTLMVAGLPLNVTQAAAGTVPAGVPVLLASGLHSPFGVAVDAAGKVYFADQAANALKAWNPGNNAVTTLVGNLNSPRAVAVDHAGNVYFSDASASPVKVWSPVSSNVTTLTLAGLGTVSGLAVDPAGNLYLADTTHNALKRWNVATGLITVVSNGLQQPYGLAADAAGNVYLANYGGNSVLQWSPVNGLLTTLAGSAVFGSVNNHPSGVAVDGAGNVYFDQTAVGALTKWTAAGGGFTNLATAAWQAPAGVGVDASGNLYVADTTGNSLWLAPQAWVDPAPRFENALAGGDQLTPVLPVENLTGPLAPTSDQSWLTVTNTTAGVVRFAFTANATHVQRIAHLGWLGQTNVITQAAAAAAVAVPVTGVTVLPGHVLHLSFTNWPGATFSVLGSTNLGLPLARWTVLGQATNVSGGLYQFTTPPATNAPFQFLRLRSP